MARISYLDLDEVTPEVSLLFEAEEKAMGRISNHSRMMARAPHIHQWHLPLTLSVKSASTGRIDKHLKNAIIVRVSAVNECAYCVTHNAQFAQSTGVDAERTEALQQDDWSARTDLFDQRECAALRWAELVTRNQARRDQEAFEDLCTHFDEAGIVEITYIAAHRTMQNLLQEALWTDLEDPGTPAHTDMPADFLPGYVNSVLVPSLARDP